MGCPVQYATGKINDNQGCADYVIRPQNRREAESFRTFRKLASSLVPSVGLFHGSELSITRGFLQRLGVHRARRRILSDSTFFKGMQGII